MAAKGREQTCRSIPEGRGSACGGGSGAAAACRAARGRAVRGGVRAVCEAGTCGERDSRVGHAPSVCPPEGQSCPHHQGAVLQHSLTETLGIFNRTNAHQTFEVQGIQQVSDEQPVSVFFFGYNCVFHAKCCVLKYT